MSWLKKTTDAAKSAATLLGGSVAFIKRQFNVTVTDDQVDALEAKARQVSDQIEAILADYIDDIPGVPTIVATLAASLAMKAVDAAIAGAGEAVKAKN